MMNVSASTSDSDVRVVGCLSFTSAHMLEVIFCASGSFFFFNQTGWRLKGR